MITQRAYMGTDTPIEHWVRGEAGNRDFTGDALTVDVFGYGEQIKLFTLDAASAVAGKVTFTIPTDKTEQYMAPGVYRYIIKAGDAVAAGGIVELV